MKVSKSAFQAERVGAVPTGGICSNKIEVIATQLVWVFSLPIILYKVFSGFPYKVCNWFYSLTELFVGSASLKKPSCSKNQLASILLLWGMLIDNPYETWLWN